MPRAKPGSPRCKEGVRDARLEARFSRLPSGTREMYPSAYLCAIKLHVNHTWKSRLYVAGSAFSKILVEIPRPHV